jgi:hypothetical protein
MSKLYDSFIDKKQRIRQLNRECAELEGRVAGSLKRRGKPYQGAGGTISLATRPVYDYSESVKEMTVKLNDIRKLERENDIATKTERNYVYYAPNNNL